jgi:hypothetical protein
MEAMSEVNDIVDECCACSVYTAAASTTTATTTTTTTTTTTSTTANNNNNNNNSLKFLVHSALVALVCSDLVTSNAALPH